MTFDMELIKQGLEIMVVGMGGIFASLLIIYASSALLLKIFPEETHK
ncbi:OadG-related small transporter subunit [Erysipelothrix larvae]|nr:OadG-related small transporter subunit [Erysipelothrix larvae]